MWGALLLMCVACIIPSVFQAASSTDFDIEKVHRDINTYYDALMPAPVLPETGYMPHRRMQGIHSKRCSHTEPGQAILRYKEGAYGRFAQGRQLLVVSSCLYSESLGNWLSNYFENLLCADRAGLHFLTVAKIWEPWLNDTASPFFSQLPSYLLHPRPAAVPVEPMTLKQLCPCATRCHEQRNSLLLQGKDFIRPIVRRAVDFHLAQLPYNSTTVLSSDLCGRPAGTVLPLIPEAAIHYRCSDNFQGQYGFLPFSAFKLHIPHNAKTIYVLAEGRNRKGSKHQHLAQKCDAVFAALFSYLRSHFPSAVVLVRRGGDLYVDFIRLSKARTTVCSVSTFCLFPAIASENAFFPVTPLVAGRGVDMGFQWISSQSVVLGAAFVSQPPMELVKRLSP
ncbi:hypothetical protein B484DRAFT_458079 [Ochromonadaceae sp. CCMP2298]|nr:hypothetical protein B484DRAFT_458079 [Ochromonadaceae sp. CCMP2298]|mmetsp:Transcript_12338/g.27470  ORF Transcript_12338/g.27470 Transcript_12338/m.27470 type:complete len:393 (-) Transcript_12338:142-1320(-)|eukprot:CAMPEP_0173191030 /NCGR_PEP_ID=MMETSP1141-20130122/12666_1 /TAXON_ID=483371 /ORGANISM="non described non described, Strain CCMP2298" /LENGTH=392 /DNA_ID=CAMNT_0014115189 /DNA_START=98 /DNA_END=1276 /DNA_ORIENTATION=-